MGVAHIAIKADSAGSLACRPASELAPELYRDLLEVPYLENGRDPAVGLDCWGVVMVLMARLGTPVPDPYSLQPLTAQPELVAQLYADWMPVPPQAGALAVFTRNFRRIPDHAGVLVSARWFLHAAHFAASPRGRVTLSERLREPYRSQWLGAYGHR